MQKRGKALKCHHNNLATLKADVELVALVVQVVMVKASPRPTWILPRQDQSSTGEI